MTQSAVFNPDGDLLDVRRLDGMFLQDLSYRVDFRNDGAAAPADEWSALAIFAPVHHVKSRRDCVLLPFEALVKALG